MENKSLILVSNSVSRFPSDMKKSPGLLYQMLTEYLFIIKKTMMEKAFPRAAYVVQPVIIDWLSTDESKQLIEQYFLDSLQEERKAENNRVEELYTAWVSIERDIPAMFNKLQEQGRIRIIPAAAVNFPLTHLLTDWGIQFLIDQSIRLYQQHFSQPAKGFWIPGCAYTPGIDLYLIKSGIEYTFISPATFSYSEKEMDTEVLKTPRGLRLIPVGKDLSHNYIHIIDSDSEMVDILQQGGFNDYNEQKLLNSTAALTRAGFGYLGMEEGQRILPDEVLIHMREMHGMEKSLQEINEDGMESPRIFSQMAREWLSSLRYLAVEQELDAASLQAFRQLHDHLTNEIEDSHFLEYRESLEYLPLELAKFSVGNSLRADKQQTVLLLSWEYPPNIVGGLSRHVHDLSVSLVKKGCKVIVLTAATNGVPDYEINEGVHVYRTGPLHPMEEDFLQWVFQLNLSFIEKAGEIFEKEAIHLVHAHDWIVGKSAVLIKNHYHIPLLTTIHATENGRNQGIFTDLHKRIHEEEKILVNASNQLIICSEHMKDELSQLDPPAHLPVTVIPNGVNLKNVLSDESGQVNSTFDDVRYYFSIGRIVHEKGFDTIIETAERISEDQSIHFVIAGKGPLLEQYRNKVTEKGLEQYVHFLGYVSDEERNAYLFKSEAVIFPSIYEPFGIVALEAMAAKKAVIASRTGGLTNIVEHGHAGLLFEPGDSGSLANAILSIEESNEMKVQMGENGFKMAEIMFSWERISQQTIGIYEEMIIQHKVEGALS
ncbi:glycosyltransferase [Bacillus sp. AK031]